MMALLRVQPRAVGAQPVNHVPAEIPRAGMVISTILSMLTISVLAVFLTRRIQTTKDWSKGPLTRWLILAIYCDSILFIFATAILEHGFGLNLNMTICGSAILLCLVCYMSTKLIYYLLVEKVYIIRRVSKPRLKSKLYLFNCFGMLLPYIVCVILNFVYRTAHFTPNGTCVIGMEMKAMMPLIIFDAVVNLYLTLLFVLPLRSLYSYKNSRNSVLRTIALRSFIGCLATLTSSVVNLTVLMVLKGEEAWICLMCCNADILFSVLVLHWVTSKDSGGGSSRASGSLGIGSRRKLRQESQSIVSPSTGAVGKLERFGVFDDYVIGGGSVVTHISAEKANAMVDMREQDEKEMWKSENANEGRMKRGKSGSGDNQLGRNQVQVGHTVETRPNNSAILSMNDSEDMGDFRLVPNHYNTDELVRKV